MHQCIKDTFNGKKTKREITDSVLAKVRNSGDGYGTECIFFPTDKIFDTEEKAVDFIDDYCGDKFYAGCAVKFYDYTNVKSTAKIIELRNKISENNKKKIEYIKQNSVKNQKAAYIGCRSCGSKLNKDKLRGESCPLCYSDLRSATVLNRINGFDKKKDELLSKIETEQIKQKKKAEIKWLVGYEYHC